MLKRIEVVGARSAITRTPVCREDLCQGSILFQTVPRSDVQPTVLKLFMLHALALQSPNPNPNPNPNPKQSYLFRSVQLTTTTHHHVI